MPYTGELREEQLLTQFSTRYRNNATVGEVLFPVIPVDKQADKYLVGDKSSFRIPNALRTKGTEAARVSWSATTATYAALKYGLEDFIVDDDRSEADLPLSLETRTIENLTDLMALGAEARYVTAAATLGATSAPGTKWDVAGADTKGDIAAAMTTILEACGKKPNVMVLPWQVVVKLRANTLILDAIKYTQPGVVTADVLASYWEIDRVVVPTVLYDTAKEGKTASLGFLWPDTCYLAYVDPNPAKDVMTMGATFRVRYGSNDRQVVSWRKPEIDSDVYRVDLMQAEAVVCTGAGLRIPTVLT
jgi:hypothetical protein